MTFINIFPTGPMASSESSLKAVFLGVAEVRLPLRLLPPERQPTVASLAYKAITEAEITEDEKREIGVSIGIIDAQYAFHEVTLDVIDECCLLKRGQEVILRHRVRDVIYGQEVGEKSINVIYITRSENFGRAAVVLMTKTADDAQDILLTL